MEGGVFRGHLIYLSQYTEKTQLSFVMSFNLKAVPGFAPIFGRLSLVLQIIFERNVCSELFEKFPDECLFA